MPEMLDKILRSPELADAAKRLGAGRTVALSGVWGSAGALAAAALGRQTGKCVLLLAGHIDAADAAADDIEVFTGTAAHLFPAWEVDVGSDHLNEEITGDSEAAAMLAREARKPYQIDV